MNSEVTNKLYLNITGLPGCHPKLKSINSHFFSYPSTRKGNLVADFLSHVPRADDIVVVEDQFPNEHLFDVIVKTP